MSPGTTTWSSENQTDPTIAEQVQQARFGWGSAMYSEFVSQELGSTWRRPLLLTDCEGHWHSPYQVCQLARHRCQSRVSPFSGILVVIPTLLLTLDSPWHCQRVLLRARYKHYFWRAYFSPENEIDQSNGRVHTSNARADEVRFWQTMTKSILTEIISRILWALRNSIRLGQISVLTLEKSGAPSLQDITGIMSWIVWWIGSHPIVGDFDEAVQFLGKIAKEQTIQSTTSSHVHRRRSLPRHPAESKVTAVFDPGDSRMLPNAKSH